MAMIEGFRVQNLPGAARCHHRPTMESARSRAIDAASHGNRKERDRQKYSVRCFRFHRRLLAHDVETACDLKQRGGFDRLRSMGCSGPIRFEIYYREGTRERPITYELAIGLDESGRPFVQEERLRQRRKGQNRGRPFSFFICNGVSATPGRARKAWKGKTPTRCMSRLTAFPATWH